MAAKDPIKRFLSWPVFRAVRNRIRRVFPAVSGHRRLKMPVLETERLVLRKIELDDFKDIVAWGEVASGQSAEAEARKFLDYCVGEYRAGGAGPWGMQWKETGAIVGNCGFPHIIFPELCGEMNYYVAPQHRGKGLAVEALEALLKFGFREIGLTRIQGRCEPDNFASERVMQKLGMKFEGFIEHAPFSNEPPPKQKLYAILREEFSLSASGSDERSTNLKPLSDGEDQGPASR